MLFVVLALNTCLVKLAFRTCRWVQVDTACSILRQICVRIDAPELLFHVLLIVHNMVFRMMQPKNSNSFSVDVHFFISSKGEEVKKLDLLADQAFCHALRQSEQVG